MKKHYYYKDTVKLDLSAIIRYNHRDIDIEIFL